MTSMSDLTLSRFRLLTGMMTLICDVSCVETVRFSGFGKTKVYRLIFANLWENFFHGVGLTPYLPRLSEDSSLAQLRDASLEDMPKRWRVYR